MKNTSLKKAFMTASILIAVGHAGITPAHSVGGVIDGGGNNASATDLGQVTCFDDGDGPTAYLFTQIQDQSPSGPVPGLLISVQAYKGNQMTNNTAPVSGGASPGAQLSEGNGVYYVSASKTAAGARTFEVTYHCMTAGNIHTGTGDINGLQIQ